MALGTEHLPWFLGPASHLTYTRTDVPYLVLDFETTNLEFGSAINPDNRLVMGYWMVVHPDGRVQRKYQFGDEYFFQELLDDIAFINEGRGFIVAHNAKFELQWLRRCGLDLRTTLAYCTMLGQWVLDGNTGLGQRGLDALAVRYGVGRKATTVSILMDSGVCPSAIRTDWLLRYCRRDVELCHDIFLKQRARLAEEQQLHLAHVRNLTCSVLADIEFEGMTLDPVRVKEEYERTLAEWNETAGILYELTGGINLASPKQVGEFLFKTLKFDVPVDYRGKPLTTASGAPSTNAAALGRLSPTTPEQRAFLDAYRRFNRVDSLLSKNLVFFKKICEEYDCKFYGIFNQGVVDTHRLSSSGRPVLFKGEKKAKGPQLQNLPRIYKKLFGSGDDDWLIGDADGAQLEFRVAADICGDPVATLDIENGEDIHSITAATLTAAGEPTSRQEAKSRTFRPLYGGQSGTPAEVEYVKFFQKKYHAIYEEQTRWTRLVLNNKKLRTKYGLTFFWPDTRMSRSGYISNTTNIFNYPIQGLATGEIIPIAMVHFWHRIVGRRIKIFTTVHDSIGSKVHKEEVEAYKEISKQALTTDVYNFLREIYGYEFKVPLGVGIKLSTHWGDSKEEFSWNVWPDGRETFTHKE